MKNVILSCFALSLIGGFFYFNTVKENTQFKQKKPNKLKKAQRIDGAMAFWEQIRNNEVTGEIPAGAYERAYQQLAAYGKKSKNSALNVNWENLGPANMAGRVRAIMVDPDNTNRVYGGSVSGGLYRSDNSGDSWYPIAVTEDNSNHAVTAISKDRFTNTYFYGTGEYRFDFSSASGDPDASMFRGNGLYKSTDGKNFDWMPATNPNTTVTTDAWYAAYQVYRMFNHPDSTGVMYVATNRGLLRTGDGGTTWKQMKIRPTGSQTIVVNDLEYKKGDSLIYYTARYTSSACRLNKLNVLTNTITETNLPNSTISPRTEIALSDDKNTIYAITLATNFDHSGVYRSTDRGTNWLQIGPASSSTFDLMGPNNQGFYDVSFEVSPKQQDSTEMLLAGGLDVWRWSTARGWEQISQWSIPNAFQNNPKSFGFKYEYIHADQHTVAFNPSNPNQVFVGCDGGIFRSNNRSFSFKSVPNGFVSFQYYDMDVDPTGAVLGGAQDNGSNLRSGGGNNALNNATELVGGDGFDQYLSKKKPSTGIVTQYNGAMYRFAINPANGNISADGFYDENIDSPAIGTDGVPDDAVGFKWDLMVHEPLGAAYKDSAYCIIGTSVGLWITDGNTFNIGKTPKWHRISPTTGVTKIANASCYAVAHDADSVLYVGTTGGNVYRLKYFYQNSGAAVQASITRIFSASGRYITGLSANAKNPNELYISLGSWQGGTSAAYIAKMTDAATRTTLATIGSGATTLNAPGGTNGFPQVPAYCVNVNRYNTQQVFVGTDLGVFGSEDGGATWVDLNDFDGNTNPKGLPRIPVLSMKPLYYDAYTVAAANNTYEYAFLGETDYLYLGTHARGWYKTLGKINSVGKNDIVVDKPSMSVYPNPASQDFTVALEMKNAGNLAVKVLSLEGKTIYSHNHTAFAGNNLIQINNLNAPAGVYLVSVIGTNNKGQVINVNKKITILP